MATKSRLELLVHRARIGRFVSIGAMGAVIETIILAILTATVGLGPLAAKVIGAEASITTMFVANDRWTFATEGGSGATAFVRRWLRSHLVRLVGLSVGFAVLYLLTSVVEYRFVIASTDLWPTVANVVGIGLGLGFNYVAESLFTWSVVGGE